MNKFIAVAGQVAVAEIVAVDQHDVGTAGHGRRVGAECVRVDSGKLHGCGGTGGWWWWASPS